MAKPQNKGTGEHRERIAKILKDQEMEANKASLQPTFEGTAMTVFTIQTIDYVTVTESIGASQG